MSASAGTAASDRDRLLDMRAARASQDRPERPFTRGADPIAGAVACDSQTVGVPCSASFARAELQRRFEAQRAAAR